MHFDTAVEYCVLANLTLLVRHQRSHDPETAAPRHGSPAHEADVSNEDGLASAVLST
jgi:hypothetical protein